MVYKNKEDVGYCFIARRADDTELIYYQDMEGMLDYINKTVKKS